VWPFLLLKFEAIQNKQNEMEKSQCLECGADIPYEKTLCRECYKKISAEYDKKRAESRE
jgi:ribosomal protein L40E